MPTPTKGARLGGSPAHQRLILANLATALFEHGRITTTETKARRLRPVAEKLITKAKKGDLHNRREVLKTIRDKSVVHTLFTEIAPTLRGASGWLHPDHQDRPAQGRQRPDGGDRAGDRGVPARRRSRRSPRQDGRGPTPAAGSGRRGSGRGDSRRGGAGRDDRRGVARGERGRRGRGGSCGRGGRAEAPEAAADEPAEERTPTRSPRTPERTTAVEGPSPVRGGGPSCCRRQATGAG